MATIQLRHVTKHFGTTVVLQDISFDVADGELVVLVGPSGCGKSTVLRLIAGLEQATAGDILIGSRVVNQVAARDRDIAMVFQSYALYPHFTVYDNMAFALRMRKMSTADIDARVKEAAALLGLSDLLHRKPRQLSGGQRQRVALGRALVRHPQAFLFDEPLSNLDAKLRTHTRTELARLHKQLGATMIYVTHDQVEAMTLGQRIIVLKDGVIQQVDTPLNVYRKPANRFVAGFIGSPAMNFLPAKLSAEGLRLDALTLPVPDRIRTAARSDRLVLGLRPEQVMLRPPQSAEAAFEIAIEVIEPLGNEVLVYGRIGEQRIVVRAEPSLRATPDDRLPATFDPTTAHYFDGDTDAALD